MTDSDNNGFGSAIDQYQEYQRWCLIERVIFAQMDESEPGTSHWMNFTRLWHCNLIKLKLLIEIDRKIKRNKKKMRLNPKETLKEKTS